MQNRKTVLMLIDTLKAAIPEHNLYLLASDSNLLALIALNGKLNNAHDLQAFNTLSHDNIALLDELHAKASDSDICTAYHNTLEAALYDICSTLGLITEITAFPVVA